MCGALDLDQGGPAGVEGSCAPGQQRPTQRLQRHAQFRLDFVEAENSTGFHAPGEAGRILAESIDLARQGQIALRDAGYRAAPAPPAVKAAVLAN